ncbi:intraflagellar transport protein 46 homolog [Eurytemora carolleeae]|uniref:intraflagellar transport protein 46 homolog n=1 Tax=Eurytemora carolleeae TaxID=1294199 RepID=UPI000C78D66A|nr:intraflagellar transport protein 46 homolog [Eurytemora carolleeae]|eukprot:XP_023344942.1 intraflagellar transport protein 46 homolog [Eurytemora affinis]
MKKIEQKLKKLTYVMAGPLNLQGHFDDEMSSEIGFQDPDQEYPQEYQQGDSQEFQEHDDAPEDPEDLDDGFDGLDAAEEVDIHLPAEDLNNPQNEDDDEGDDDDDDDEDDDDDVAVGVGGEGSYDPSQYNNLNVEPEVKDLFALILKYTPQTIENEMKFRPFIPDYIPAVGDIDAFIRVPRHDGTPEMIGLKVLDEPAAQQSDPSVLELQIRVVSKQSASTSARVKRVAGEQSKDVEKWIRDISDLHRSKPNPTVHYNKPMPEIDLLMQEWPEEFEDALNTLSLPTAGLNIDLSAQVDIMCGLLDIPVYRSRVQALHVLFSLYSAFRSNQFLGDMKDEGLYQN